MSKSGASAWRSTPHPSEDPAASPDPTPSIGPRWAATGEDEPDATGEGPGGRHREGAERPAALVSRSSFDLDPQTLFSLATRESVRYAGSVACIARTWGDATVGFRSKVELDWRGCRGLGLVRGRKYQFGGIDAVTFETAPPYPTSYGVRGRATVRTQPGGACEALYLATLRVGGDAAVRIVGIEIRALERARPT